MTTVIELLQEVRRLISIVIEIGRILCPRHCQRQSLRNAVIACGGCFKSLMFKTTSILCPRAYTSTAHVTKIQIEPLLHTLTCPYAHHMVTGPKRSKRAMMSDALEY